MDTRHETLKSAADSMIVLGYSAGSPLIGEYLKRNGIRSIRVSRHSLGEKGWQVWLCTGADLESFASGGWPTWTRKRQTARALAIMVSQRTGLPVFDETRANVSAVQY